MKDIEYDGNLVEDIKLSKKKFNIFSKFLTIYLVQSLFLTGMAGIIGALATGAAFSTFVVNTFPLIGAIIWGSNIPIDILVTKKKKSIFEKKKEKAKKRLLDFSETLKINENIDIPVNSLQTAQVEKTITNQEHYQNDKLDKTLNTIMEDIYCLDFNGQIQALKATREALISQHRVIKPVKKEIKTNLQVYEGADIKREELHKRLARNLSFKPKK